ncbi:hypothetical protein [Burkholderia cepacia]|uniref:hypothetical protein n=1 Tax=Burkholderia cepacia TaxID=292 RepID=UPI000A6B5398|nr:hypothetical protein [Burkholderia cepacia]
MTDQQSHPDALTDAMSIEDATCLVREALGRLARPTPNAHGFDIQIGGIYWRLAKVLRLYVAPKLDIAEGCEHADYIREHNGVMELAPSASPAELPVEAPIPVLLFCPRCGTQHIDAPETEPGRLISSGPNAGRAVPPRVTWDKPPHRSHLCHACGIIWRPADVATVGVAAIETHGKADTWTASTPWIGHNRPVATSSNEAGAEGAIELPQWFEMFLTNVCELPDRNSPEDEPDAIVATLDELRNCALNAIEQCVSYAAPQPAQADAPAEAREPVPSLTNPLTPFGMLVRALRIVAGTNLFEMAQCLSMTPAQLSAMEFGREPVTPEIVREVGTYFESLGIHNLRPALQFAIDAARAGEPQ